MSTELYAADDVARHLDLEGALAVVEKTYREMSRGRVLNPPKSTMHMGDDGEWPHLNAFAIDMPAYVDWLGVAGTKWAVATWDVDADQPISARIQLFDPDHGAFTALLEGMYLTGVRTALQSVVGLTHLAPTEPSTVGMFGAGYQARFQVRVLDTLLDVDAFTVFDVETDHARDLAADLRPALSADLHVADAPAAAAAADAVVTVTDSKTPVLDDDWLDDPTLLVALGSYQELPDATVLGADRVVVDHVEQCLQRGALSQLADRDRLDRDAIDATIGDVLDADEPPYPGPADADRVLFVPIGLGAIDVALAEHVRRAAPDDAVESFQF